MTGNEARSRFLDYFESRHHRIVRSSSLVPQSDPTLLFVNAGMVQFKRVFIGEEKRDYHTAATSQKCVRAGGKHNDLDNVGYTARHHTFFEMLGNFSFGDYFKEKAIELAWDLLLNGYGLPQDKLWVSVFREDDEAYNIWKNAIGIPESRIVRLGEKDNFWAMGDTGPCGPCSEILIDRGPEHGCGRPDCAVGCECDRYLEIWNMVFMQYNRDDSGHLTPLPKPSIDTGMGLERISSVVQNTITNYETDLIFPIIQTIENLAGRSYGKDLDADVCMRVIADHSRAAAFLIGDGILPSNEGRGYVLRRIMRRAIRYGRNLGLDKPFLHKTALTVLDIMAGAYPELKDAGSFITNVIENEEMRFSETLDNGLRVLNDTLADIRARKESVIPGDVIFKLYDTYGFPVDIVKDMVRGEQIELDTTGFELLMAGQREKSRSVAEFSRTCPAYGRLAAEGVKTAFVGYGSLEKDATVLVLVRDGAEVKTAEPGETIELVADQTPFYAESGGQAGDTGTITGRHFKMKVTDTVKEPSGLVIHRGQVESGTVSPGDLVTLAVDGDRRRMTACNHSATHLLHTALRRVVGDHVKQAGSLVSAERLRFDFTHFAMVEPEALEKIEAFVNARIGENYEVSITEMGIDQAMESGATALFEEKYGDTVRVIAMGDVSRELCGGTHTRRTGDIGLFKIVSEGSVASGVRRIEALTGAAALAHVQENMRVLSAISGLLKEQPLNLPPRVQKMLKDMKALEKEKEGLKNKLAAASVSGGGGGDGGAEHALINGVKVIARVIAVDNPAALRTLADQLKDKLQSGIVVLGAADTSKAFLIVSVTKDLTGRFKAGAIIKEAAAVVGGSGGGRPDMAQAGGSQPEKIAEAVAKAVEIIRSTVA
ncbi:MAG: alanine--tRNA ligase [Thermodesulfobacteriota bacterium]